MKLFLGFMTFMILFLATLYLRKFTTTTETYRSLVVCILCPTECGDRNLPSECGRLHFPLPVTSVRNLIKKKQQIHSQQIP